MFLLDASKPMKRKSRKCKFSQASHIALKLKIQKMGFKSSQPGFKFCIFLSRKAVVPYSDKGKQYKWKRDKSAAFRNVEDVAH